MIASDVTTMVLGKQIQLQQSYKKTQTTINENLLT